MPGEIVRRRDPRLAGAFDEASFRPEGSSQPPPTPRPEHNMRLDSGEAT
jgi:hypothetical protein